MRTIRDVDVSTIGMQYKLHVQPSASCGVRLPFAKALHRSKEGLSGAALYLPGIGHAVCWKALNVVRRVLRTLGASAVTH